METSLFWHNWPQKGYPTEISKFLLVYWKAHIITNMIITVKIPSKIIEIFSGKERLYYENGTGRRG